MDVILCSILLPEMAWMRSHGVHLHQAAAGMN
uniref:Uncharacterized protein n=1 Tax=Arundo donax TaxID=35708 RepID=A0A0A8YBA0_ARUDO